MKIGKAKYIWHDGAVGVDEYAEFIGKFAAKKGKKTTLKITGDGVYAAYLNGKLAAFSAFNNFPDYKYYEETDVTALTEKENELKIAVWYFGVNSQTYIADKAGVLFEITSGGKTILKSGKNILSRKMNEYKNGYKKVITSQLGFSYLYDNTAVKSGYRKSKVTGSAGVLHKKEILPLNLSERLPIKITDKENSVLIDMGKETAGFLDMDFYSAKPQKITFAYGEHLENGSVKRIIGDRDFSVEFIARSGDNSYMNALRRIAGRYVEIFSEQPIKVNYVGIRPVFYPVKAVDKNFGDELLNKIYDVSVYTLRCCMHEHYEDCPWREQALYTLDSRNQMLLGYYAFNGGNKDYARYNLELINRGLRKDGLLSICFPSGIDIPIPFFSFAYIIQVYEYVKHTKDESVLAEFKHTLKSIADTFTEKVEENGLIATFPYPYWNFYEWAEESSNAYQIGRKESDGHVKGYDLILNCAYVYAMRLYDGMFGVSHDTEKTVKAIKDTFYNGKYYKLSTLTEKGSQFGNAFAVLIGLGGEELAETIISDKSLIKATLSVKTFVYDALLSCGDKYKGYILDDIKNNYKKMLDAGATTFWETEKGAADFDGAGSLCHGWSAIPIYYFDILL